MNQSLLFFPDIAGSNAIGVLGKVPFEKPAQSVLHF
jgi:hypothetical protein